MIANELTIFFDDVVHQQLHDLLLARGFNFVMLADMRIGRTYQHPEKPLHVTLCAADGEFWTVITDTTKPHRAQILADADYSNKEWDWLQQADDVVEYLRRELHILLNVRPKFMTRAPWR